jgi:hypothetical protein
MSARVTPASDRSPIPRSRYARAAAYTSVVCILLSWLAGRVAVGGLVWLGLLLGLLAAFVGTLAVLNLADLIKPPVKADYSRALLFLGFPLSCVGVVFLAWLLNR